MGVELNGQESGPEVSSLFNRDGGFVWLPREFVEGRSTLSSPCLTKRDARLSYQKGDDNWIKEG